MILCMLKVTKLFNDKQVWWLPIKYKVWKNSLGKFVELRENLERFIEVGAADGAEFGVGPSGGWGHAGVAGGTGSGCLALSWLWGCLWALSRAGS